MLRFRILAVATAIYLAATAGAGAVDIPDDVFPTNVTRSYTELAVHYGLHGEETGPLRLNSKFASFKAIRGHMDLEFVKEIPGDRSYSKMQIYRIVNAEKFFADNGRLKDVNANWLGVAPNGPAYPGTIRLFFIRSADVPNDLKDVYQHDRMSIPYRRDE